MYSGPAPGLFIQHMCIQNGQDGLDTIDSKRKCSSGVPLLFVAGVGASTAFFGWAATTGVVSTMFVSFTVPYCCCCCCCWAGKKDICSCYYPPCTLQGGRLPIANDSCMLPRPILFLMEGRQRRHWLPHQPPKKKRGRFSQFQDWEVRPILFPLALAVYLYSKALLAPVI